MATPSTDRAAPPVAGEEPIGPGPVAQTIALLQPWIDYVPKRQRRLGLFVLAAFFVHLTAFYFIRIDTTRAESTSQPHAHVAVESPETTELAGRQGTDEFWDKMNDPRLFLFPQTSRPDLTPGESTLDIDATIGSKQLPPAATPGDFQFAQPVVTPVEQQVAEAMRPPRQPFHYQETPRPIAAQTSWQWEDALAQRLPASLPELPSPVSDTDLGPTELNVAIAPSGTVEHVFAEQSCGSLDLDQLAVQAARKIRFHSTDQPGLFWGQLTVFWHYSPKPQDDIVPTPPSGP